jgi:hypothetical protein
MKARGKIERPDDFPEDAERWKRTGDLRHAAYPPNAEGVTVGVPWRTNEWGMRDRSYSKEKPPGTYRIAMMGASYTMGRGVVAEADFESRLEELLNRDGAASRPVEVLNFASSNYTLLESAFVAEHVIPPFQPDAMFYVVHGIERKRTCRKLVQLALRRKAELSYDYLKDVVVRAKLDARVSDDENLRRLEAFGDELVAWSYRTMVGACRKSSIVPVWILLPTSDRANRAEADFAAESPVAEAAGFRVLAIENPYRGKSLEDIALNQWDSHPNAASHRDIARQLFATLHKRQGALQLGLTLNRASDDE